MARQAGVTAPTASAHLARLEQGDLSEAAETWAALLTAGPAAGHLPGSTHLVLTDSSELRAIAAELDAQAAERREGLVASGELPVAWPLPYEAVATLEALEGRAAERLEEQAAQDAGFHAAPVLPGRAERLGPWLAELAETQRVVVTTDTRARPMTSRSSPARLDTRCPSRISSS